MAKYDISICVLTYKPDFMELMLTILSALGQKGVSFEIIISDDGSETNYFPELEKLFAEKGFVDYKLIGHKENQGTVKNCWDAVCNADGEYTKLISPGDYICDMDVLDKMVSFMKRKASSVSFCDLIYYRRGNLYSPVVDRAMPQEIKAYQEDSAKKQLQYYMILSDKVCGACWLTVTALVKKYLARIVDHVMYSEDSIYRLMIADGIRFDYFPISGFLYQLGDGISTNGSSIWRERLYRDDSVTNEILVNRLKESKGSKRLIYFIEVEKEHNRKKTNLMKVLLFPGAAIRWVILNKHPRYTEEELNYCYIAKCAENFSNIQNKIK